MDTLLDQTLHMRESSLIKQGLCDVKCRAVQAENEELERAGHAAVLILGAAVGAEEGPASLDTMSLIATKSPT